MPEHRSRGRAARPRNGRRVRPGLRDDVSAPHVDAVHRAGIDQRDASDASPRHVDDHHPLHTTDGHVDADPDHDNDDAVALDAPAQLHLRGDTLDDAQPAALDHEHRHL